MLSTEKAKFRSALERTKSQVHNDSRAQIPLIHTRGFMISLNIKTAILKMFLETGVFIEFIANFKNNWFIAVGIAALLGIALGSIAGYYGKWVDKIIMRFIDIMLCFPTFFLILAVIALLEPSIINIMIIIGATSWMGMARLIRAEILSLKERDFIYAERAIGAGDLRIIIRHLIPNAMAPVLVSITLGIAGAILVESSLSFLGIGVQPPTPSWGNILSEGKAVMGAGWWMMLFPGLAIFITVLGYNLLGEGIREKLLK